MQTIKRDIYVTKNVLQAPIEVTEGTNSIAIEFDVRDYDIPASAAAVAYSLSTSSMEEPNKALADVSGNKITIIPSETFFLPGQNVMQVRIIDGNSKLISFNIIVKCTGKMRFGDEKEAKQSTLIEQILAKLGEYTGELDVERKRIDKITNSIQNITNRLNKEEFFPLIIGDSYNTTGIATPTWGEIFQNNMNLTDNENSKNLGYASRGFIGYGDGDYITELKKDLPNLSENLKTKITACIICGGANDCNENVTEDKLTLAIKNTCNYITSVLPNCKTFYIGFISRNLLTNNTFYIYRAMYRKVVTNLHYTWLNGMENALYDSTHFRNDNLHPNENGMIDIANALTECIKTGYYYICSEWRDINYTLNSTLDVGDATKLIKERFNNGKCELMIMETNINNLSTTSVKFFSTTDLRYFRPQIYNNQEIFATILNNVSMCLFSTYTFNIRCITSPVVKIYNTLISLDIA